MSTSAGDVTQVSGGGSATLPSLTADQLVEVIALLPGADSVELKVSVPEVARRSVVRRLGMDPLDAQLRQVAFFDTPELTLSDHGLVVRARRIQRRPGDAVVEAAPGRTRRGSCHPCGSCSGFGVEVDAMPGRIRLLGKCSRLSVDDKVVKSVLAW